MTVASISGIRGIFNEDLLPDELIGHTRNFAGLVGSREILLGTDTRTTGATISRMVSAAALAAGADVTDYGVISTPALFRESRKKRLPAIMVTASHNEPQWNGLKFMVDGRGINQTELNEILRKTKQGGGSASGRLRHAQRSSYNSELVTRAGEGSLLGVRVVLDLNGGAAIYHAPQILHTLGCHVSTFGDSQGLFVRAVDPTNDPLEMLCKTVRREGADVGFAFDCDGDRLVVVDSDGRKRSGDYMLTLALKEMLQNTKEKDVVVSVDTTQAVDEVVREVGGKVYRSRVGESHVIEIMSQVGVRIGGEGSSGGLIDSDFNYCRDSLLAATTIAGALKKKGTKVFGQVKAYHQARLKLATPRRKALESMRRLVKEHPEADTLDGIKIRLSGSSWVLIRSSGTEDVVRVSAEAPSAKEAEELAHSYLNKLKRAGA